MFFKLARKNVTRSLKDYSVYFLTLTLGVSLFYVFNSLEGQWAMQMLAKSAHYMVESILIFMNIFSAFVSVVLACLVLYANTFLMKRRKRELGTYFLLGLPAGRVSLLLVLETLLIGLMALATGLVLGVLLAQGLGLLTIAMFSAYPAGEQFALVLSVKAIGKTVLYFGVIFLVVMILTGVSVSRAKLIDLMQGARKNEEMKERPLWTSVLTFLAGVALLVVAYAMLLIRGMLYIDPLFFLMLALGTLGTLLFFRSLSGFLLRVVKGHKKLYYRGLNMFVLRQFNSRIHTTYLSMTVICLLLLLAIGVTACCVGLNDTIEQNTSSAAPYDVTIQNYSGDTTVADLPARLAESGFDPALLGEQHDFLFYYNDPAVTGIPADDAYAVVLLSDYNALMALQGGQALTGDGLPLVTDQAIVTGYSGMNRYLVAPDSWAEALQVRRQVFCANYRGDKQTAEDALAAACSSPAFSDGLTLSLDTRIGIYTENMGSKILVLFMGLYLGMVFLLTAAAVLALQQLSQAADNVPRYQILSRLGVPERMRDRSVLTQVALSFFLPLALAVVHSIVGMTAANAVISVVGQVDSVRSSLVTAGFLVLIYGAYFLATCFGARRIVKGNG
ncbi:FtsX-like permease family protein [Intestinimonas massiliensis]|mgnify:FL=1|jgi:putative ABC transport system permease protein|uniref:FtsX-like permease family protein n=1 Tax=Intestinimonas massiliensis (ex Afouda et al. 2020) TaxID=1673721 RepID=UPI00210CE34E|nr:FtsX-like permease family protein [Intestinimonas massiliensis (ex Afouda et al. 2020)]MCQ4807268.1 FtsX-like permease family protein [Intestinimonas massiliensis (ex Afouda et al. 2020)]